MLSNYVGKLCAKSTDLFPRKMETNLKQIENNGPKYR